MFDEPVTSYAQHGEDVVLLRALGDTKSGFYVDVGAYDPTVDSVTRLFYERGWRGVNIDPDLVAIEKFQSERPDETNLAVAAGQRDGETELYVSDVPGWSTTSPVAGERLSAESHVTRRVTVPLLRLSTILDEFPERTIDFLKVDAEGSESEVIAGLDLTRHRPRVIVLEGVAPTAPEGHATPALQALGAAGYLEAGFDGLNHYLTRESDLVAALSTPANPTDDYRRHDVVVLEDRVRQLGHDLASAERALDAARKFVARERDEHEAVIIALEQARDASVVQAEQIRIELDGIRAGISWRVTAPLRLAGVLVRRGRRTSLGCILARADRITKRFPASRELGIALVDRFPAIADTARRYIARHSGGPARRHIDFDAIAHRRATAVAALAQRARDRRHAS